MRPQFPRTSILRHVVWRDVDGELVLFDDQTRCYHALDEVGSRIWRKIAAGIDIEEIVRALSSTYDAPGEVIAEQVAAFVDRAVELNLLAKAAAAPMRANCCRSCTTAES